MKCIIHALLVMSCSVAHAQNAAPQLFLSHLTGPVYVVEDNFYSKENSVVYIGVKSVTIVGATWTPETAQLLEKEIGKVTSKPISDVINTNYHPDRAGGNAYWKGIGTQIVATQMTYDLLARDWESMVNSTRSAMPNYPLLPLVLPTATHPGNFELQGGRVKTLYLGPSHTPDGIFVYFPEEKLLYGGCILKEQIGNLAFADVAEYRKTLHKLQQLNLDIKTIVAGHWSAVHGPELIGQYLALLESN